MYQLPIDKEALLNTISQEDIFERYTGKRVKLGELFCSPLRNDRNPTCGYAYSHTGVLYMKDFSGHFWGNCFDFVMHKFNCSFKESLKIILNDFDIKPAELKPRTHTPPEKREYVDIKVVYRKALPQDMEFWNSYGITASLLKMFEVFPCDQVFINSKLDYKFVEHNLAYAYRFDDNSFKIYFPNNIKRRFIVNTTVVQGYTQLPQSGNLLVITKSMKDVMLLRRYGIYAIAPQSESNILDPELVAEMKRRFKKVVLLYDFDYAGVKGANRARKTYGLDALFLTNGRYGTRDYGAKDVSDFYKSFGAQALVALIKTAIQRGVKKYSDTGLHQKGYTEQQKKGKVLQERG